MKQASCAGSSGIEPGSPGWSKNGPQVLGDEQGSCDTEHQLKVGSESCSEAMITWKIFRIHVGDNYICEG